MKRDLLADGRGDAQYSPNTIRGGSGAGGSYAPNLNQCEPARILTKELLFLRAKELRERAAKLEALAHLVPERLHRIDPLADAALFDLVQQSLRTY